MSEIVSDTAVTTIITVVIVAYALTLGIVPSLQRWLDSGSPIDASRLAEIGVDGSRSAMAGYEQRLNETCARLAAEHGLTAREAEILRYLGCGHNSAYIADALFISSNTTRTHIHNIYGKIGVSSREDLIIMVQCSL